MGMFCLDMLAIALELSHTRPAYEAIATKFFEHFVAISHAINGFRGEIGMWDPHDGFYYDVVRVKGGPPRAPQGSLVRGVDTALCVPGDRTGHTRTPASLSPPGGVVHSLSLDGGRQSLPDDYPAAAAAGMLALADRAKLEAILPRILDPSQFLSDFGLRSMSRGLLDEPFVYDGNRVAYEPGESASPIYGGNSNWRGPIWFPVNYLMIEALREFHRYYGSSLKVELPRWSGQRRDPR